MLVINSRACGGVNFWFFPRQASAECWCIRWTAAARALFAQEKSTQTLKIPLRFFTEEEALIVAAAASRIFPSDDSGPGAKEAGVVIYIDRQLAGPYGRDRYRYTQGPFDENAPRGIRLSGQGHAARNLSRRPEGSEGLRQPFSRRAGQETAADREHASLRPAAPEHHRRNVLRSRARRQRGHGRLATGRIPRPAHEQLRRNRQALRRSVPSQAHQPRAGHRPKSPPQRRTRDMKS